MSDFDPQAAAKARKAELTAITDKLEQGVRQIFESDGYIEYLNFCARLPRYSVNNQILIMLQRPNATMCQSFTGWKNMNRYVRRGERSIRILAPAPYKKCIEQDRLDISGRPMKGTNGEILKESVEVTITSFKPISTFDISQTEGEPIPELGITELIGSVDGYTQLLDAIKESVPVPISFEDIPSGAKGFYSIEDDRIAIQNNMSEAQTIKTIIHEAAHQALHSKERMSKDVKQKSRNQRETEAESVAYIICQHFGIDTSDYSFGYVASWSADKDTPELKSSLDTIRNAASDLIVKIEDHIQAKNNLVEMEAFIREHSDELPFR